MAETVKKQTIVEKLIKVSEAVDYIQKDKDNKEQRYKYVSAAAVLGKVQAALIANRLASIPKFKIVNQRDKTTKSGAVWDVVTVECELTILDADSDEKIIAISLGGGTDSGDKAVAKAQTMALKYAWMTALNIETGDDPEADPATDKAEFTNGTNTLTEIQREWSRIGWDIGALTNYLFERFKRPMEQITEIELQTILNEAKQYGR